MAQHYYRTNKTQIGYQSNLSSNQYLSSYEGSAVRQVEEILPYQEATPNIPSPIRQPHKRTNGRLIVSLLLFCVGLLSCFGCLYYHWQAKQIDKQLQAIQQSEATLIKENERMLLEIAENLNYDRIKTVAELQGMKAELDRVKDIE